MGMSWRTKTSIFLAALLMSCLTVSAEPKERVYSKFSAANGLADNSAHTIHCTKTGRLVITTMGQINFYDGQMFTYIDATNENMYPLEKYYGNYHLYFDKYHHLWLKNTHNVTCVDLLTEKFVSSIEEEFSDFGVDEKVSDLFVDQRGVVWLLLDKGLYCSETKKTIRVKGGLNLQDLETYADKYLLLFYSNSLLEMYDLATGEKIHESLAYGKADIGRYGKTSVLYNYGSMFYQIRNGDKEAVLNQFDAEKREWKELMRAPYHLNNLAGRDSLLYIPCEYGYWTYEIGSGKTEHIEGLRMENGSELRTCLNTMAFDRQGGLWIGTERTGLLYSRPYTAPFRVYGWDDKRAGELAGYMENMPQTYTFKGKSVNCVFRDSRGWTWVGTSTGLHYYRKSSDHLPQIITVRDGLLNNVIHSITEDQLHNIWVSTSYGISCILIENDMVHYINSYNQYDNVPDEAFVNGKAICRPDGMIIMQALDHVVTFNPNHMQTLRGDYPFEIYPKLIRLMINGHEIRTGDELDGNVILERALTRTKEINLNYDQNSISLVFSALNFFRPYQTYYRVRVRGLSDEWNIYAAYNSGGLVDKRGLLHLPLMSMRPGTYFIEVQASVLPDKWDTTPYEWIININEPWWRTTGMVALFIGVLLVLIGINLYYYLRNANMRAMRNSEEVTLLKRIHNFAERCNDRRDFILEPVPEEVRGEVIDSQNELSAEFIETMIRIMPAVLSEKASRLTMRSLSEVAGIDVQHFYSLVTSNIYKSPRLLVHTMMLRKAEEMLRKSVKPIDMIAKECGFVSPNYFIASFYHAHQMTPAEYREKR